VATGATDDQIAKWIGKNAKKRPRTEIIAWNNQQRHMRLRGLVPTIHEYGRTTSRSSCRATASFTTGSMCTTWRSNGSDHATNAPSSWCNAPARPVVFADSAGSRQIKQRADKSQHG